MPGSTFSVRLNEAQEKAVREKWGKGPLGPKVKRAMLASVGLAEEDEPDPRSHRERAEADARAGYATGPRYDADGNWIPWTEETFVATGVELLRKRDRGDTLTPAQASLAARVPFDQRPGHDKLEEERARVKAEFEARFKRNG